MNKERLKYLYLRYKNKTISSTEIQEWDALIYDPNLEPQLKEILEAEWQDYKTEELQVLNAEKAEGIFKRVVSEPQEHTKLKIWPRIAVSAAAVTAITLGIWLYYSSPILNRPADGSALTKDIRNHDIAPGLVGATLTLANGKKIKLSDATKGELAKELGVVITKSADGQLIYETAQGPSKAGMEKELGMTNVLSTAKGETYTVKLPDGSMVWLNAASSLSYSPTLNQNGKRSVKLEGEAYFQVAKDKKHPFIVETQKQTVEVLGTHFNISAYHDEPEMKTTLLEGSVRLSSRADLQQVVLRPSQQAILSDKKFTVKTANMEEEMAWKAGDFYLERVDFRSAMRKIARWYNVEVIYDESVPADIRSGGWISRSNTLSAVLQSIEKSGLVHFKIEGRRIRVTK